MGCSIATRVENKPWPLGVQPAPFRFTNGRGTCCYKCHMDLWVFRASMKFSSTGSLGWWRVHFTGVHRDRAELRNVLSGNLVGRNSQVLSGQHRAQAVSTERVTIDAVRSLLLPNSTRASSLSTFS